MFNFKYALIKDGLVVGVQESPTEIKHKDLVKVEIFPSIGQPYINGVFSDIEKQSIRKITIGSFRRRLTLNEKIAIKTSSDPVVQVLDEDLKLSSYVDLDFQSLIDGLNYLETIDIITSERVTELLKDGESHESI